MVGYPSALAAEVARGRRAQLLAAAARRDARIRAEIDGSA